MRRSVIVLFSYLLCSLAILAHADIYKYVDENGQKRWTDDLSQVPKEQRQNALRIESSEEPEEQHPASSGQDTFPLKPAIGGKDRNDSNANRTPTRESLENEKAALDTQYQQLIEERKILQKINSEPKDSVARVGLNDRIAAYNRKTERYENRLKQFNQMVILYNQRTVSKSPSPSVE